MKLSNYSYDNLKFVALVLLPGLASAYFALAQIWHLPNAEQVVGTVTVLDTLLGILLRNSSTKYQDPTKVPDGNLVVGEDEDGRSLAVAWGENFKGVEQKQTVTLNVVPVRPRAEDAK